MTSGRATDNQKRASVHRARDAQLGLEERVGLAGGEPGRSSDVSEFSIDAHFACTPPFRVCCIDERNQMSLDGNARQASKLNLIRDL